MDRHCRFNFDTIARIARNCESNISSAFQGRRRVCQIVTLAGIGFEASRDAGELGAGKSEKKTLEFFRIIVAVDENNFTSGFVVSEADVMMSRAVFVSDKKIICPKIFFQNSFTILLCRP